MAGLTAKGVVVVVAVAVSFFVRLGQFFVVCVSLRVCVFFASVLLSVVCCSVFFALFSVVAEWSASVARVFLRSPGHRPTACGIVLCAVLSSFLSCPAAGASMALCRQLSFLLLVCSLSFHQATIPRRVGLVVLL